MTSVSRQWMGRWSPRAVGARLVEIFSTMERQSFLVAGVCVGLLVVVNAPLFLHMPLWPDAVFYDVCARNLARGGVHYRDTFDGNLPGILWAQMMVRSLAGSGDAALRSADLLVVAFVTGLLVAWPGKECSRTRRAWLLAALTAFYFATPESCHCQRDVWMLAPALLALTVRRQMLRPVERPPSSGEGSEDHEADAPRSPGSFRTVALLGVLEGLFWGLAVWIKPHILAPALAAWLASSWLAFRATGAMRPLVLNFGGLLAGGTFAGMLGIAWLVQTGSWPAFFNILTEWNRDYLPRDGFSARLAKLFGDLYPWGWVHRAALPLAAYSLVRRSWSRKAYSAAELGTVLLAATYLGWTIQAVYAQHAFTYHLAPTILLALTVVASSSLAGLLPFRVAIAGFLIYAAGAHPGLQTQRLVLWPTCIAGVCMPDVQDRLALVSSQGPWYYSQNQADLTRVAGFLREQHLQPGELTCYDWRTIRLYRDLDLPPSTRFLMLDVDLRYYPNHRTTIEAAVQASPQRYIVSDLTGGRIGSTAASQIGPEGPLRLPPAFPPEFRTQFPWNEPIVFRAGQYAVHRVTR